MSELDTDIPLDSYLSWEAGEQTVEYLAAARAAIATAAETQEPDTFLGSLAVDTMIMRQNFNWLQEVGLRPGMKRKGNARGRKNASAPIPVPVYGLDGLKRHHHLCLESFVFTNALGHAILGDPARFEDLEPWSDTALPDMAEDQQFIAGLFNTRTQVTVPLDITVLPDRPPLERYWILQTAVYATLSRVAIIKEYMVGLCVSQFGRVDRLLNNIGPGMTQSFMQWTPRLKSIDAQSRNMDELLKRSALMTDIGRELPERLESLTVAPNHRETFNEVYQVLGKAQLRMVRLNEHRDVLWDEIEPISDEIEADCKQASNEFIDRLAEIPDQGKKLTDRWFSADKSFLEQRGVAEIAGRLADLQQGERLGDPDYAQQVLTLIFYLRHAALRKETPTDEPLEEQRDQISLGKDIAQETELLARQDELTQNIVEHFGEIPEHLQERQTPLRWALEDILEAWDDIRDALRFRTGGTGPSINKALRQVHAWLSEIRDECEATESVE